LKEKCRAHSPYKVQLEKKRRRENKLILLQAEDHMNERLHREDTKMSQASCNVCHKHINGREIVCRSTAVPLLSSPEVLFLTSFLIPALGLSQLSPFAQTFRVSSPWLQRHPLGIHCNVYELLFLEWISCFPWMRLYLRKAGGPMKVKGKSEE
jgi:hypothetical protein